MIRAFGVTVCVWVAATTGLRAADVLGAREVVARAEAAIAAAKKAAVTPDAPKAPDAARAALDAFKAERDALSPKDAAAAWLDLFDRISASPPADSGSVYGYMISELEDEGVVTLQTVVREIPGPPAWDALAALVAKREAKTPTATKRDAALRILVRLLQGELEETRADVNVIDDAFEKATETSWHHFGSDDSATQQLRKAIRETIGFADAKGVVADYRKALDRLEKRTVAGEDAAALSVPDLVNLAGEEAARELLKRTALLPDVAPNVAAGGQTLALLKAIVLENMAAIPQPMWHLVTGTADLELYEAMDRRFPDARAEADADTDDETSAFMHVSSSYRDYQREDSRAEARAVYILSLLHAGRTDDAVAQAKAHATDRTSSYRLLRLMQADATPGLYDRLHLFLDRMIADGDGGVWWELYVPAALMAGKTEQAEKRLATLLANPDLTPARRDALLARRADLLLGTGDVEGALGALRQVCRPATDGGTGLEARREAESRIETAANRIFTLGMVLDRPELVDEGLARLDSLLAGGDDAGGWNRSTYAHRERLTQLLEAGRPGEAEALALEMVTSKLASSLKQMPVGVPTGMVAGALPDLSEELKLLVRIYGTLERFDDVLYLVREVPWWGGIDVLEDHEEPSLIVPLARALAAAGETDRAVRLLKRNMMLYAGHDSPYEALVDIAPDGALAWLDRLYARDAFEERPLIWKAVLQQRAGDLDAAENTIRQALKVDPTDGETEAGSRVKAYAVLAEILSARGKSDDAAFFNRVVRSVRTAEKGDDLSNAGLISRSLELYQKAEEDFVDAYCVQWRLAERLYAMGKHEEAEKHYEIAFERMPEQFGRVASFCFGCEGVFNKLQSRSVAERILGRLLEKNPKQPQVLFLMGQLRESQGQMAEAHALFKRAVKADPGYLDAWQQLYGMRDSLFLPKRVTDDMALTALRLDPLQRHFAGGLTQIADIPSMWQALEANQALTIELEPESIELTASKAAIKAKVSNWMDLESLRTQRRYMGYGYGYGAASMNPLSPGQALASHQVVEQLLQLLVQ